MIPLRCLVVTICVLFSSLPCASTAELKPLERVDAYIVPKEATFRLQMKSKKPIEKVIVSTAKDYQDSAGG